MQGVEVSSCKVLERGFEHDRRYMLVDENGTFISQRTHPNLVFFFPQIIDNQLHVAYENSSIRIPLEASLQNQIKTRIFDDLVTATEVSMDANQWFSSIFGQNVRLVKMGKENVRRKELTKGPKQVEVSFADGYPFLMVGTESINYLNSKLQKPLSLSRFRPNIVIRTIDPHAEDNWEKIKIGEVEFLVVKPCARCPVITVDQSSGLKSKEPLKTLATYRKAANKVNFGVNAIRMGEGTVHVDDDVYLLSVQYD
jgi:uncharacterized protein YcbX